MDPQPVPDIQFQELRGPLDALAAHDFDDGEDVDEAEEAGEVGDSGEVDSADEPKEPEEAKDPEEPEEPFVPLGSEDPPDSPSGEPMGAHTAIARSLHPPPSIPRVLRKEARSFFDGAMYAYTEGDLPGARLTFLAVAGIGDPDTAPAAMVFLGVIAYRHRDVPAARMWFTRAAAGADDHWALVAAQELRRLG
jgi:hypothetical protein